MFTFLLNQFFVGNDINNEKSFQVHSSKKINNNIMLISYYYYIVEVVIGFFFFFTSAPDKRYSVFVYDVSLCGLGLPCVNK